MAACCLLLDESLWPEKRLYVRLRPEQLIRGAQPLLERSDERLVSDAGHRREPQLGEDALERRWVKGDLLERLLSERAHRVVSHDFTQYFTFA